jgi:hypothetical protein
MSLTTIEQLEINRRVIHSIARKCTDSQTLSANALQIAPLRSFDKAQKVCLVVVEYLFSGNDEPYLSATMNVVIERS